MNQLLVFDGVGDRERFVPAEILLGAERIRFLNKSASAIPLAWCQASPDRIIERLLEGDTALAHQVPNLLFGIWVESDRRSHTYIIASLVEAS